MNWARPSSSFSAKRARFYNRMPPYFSRLGFMEMGHVLYFNMPLLYSAITIVICTMCHDVVS